MPDSEKSRFPKCHTGERAAFAACAFYALYILFNSIQFNSFHFYSIQHDENYETLRMITNDNEIKRKLRNVTKKRKMLLNNQVIVIFYAKTVYFFIHLKNENIAFPFFSSVSLFSFLVVIVRFL